MEKVINIFKEHKGTSLSEEFCKLTVERLKFIADRMKDGHDETGSIIDIDVRLQILESISKTDVKEVLEKINGQSSPWTDDVRKAAVHIGVGNSEEILELSRPSNVLLFKDIATL